MSIQSASELLRAVCIRLQASLLVPFLVTGFMLLLLPMIARQQAARSWRLAQASVQPARPASTGAATPALPNRPSRVERAKAARPVRAVTRFEFGDDEVPGNLQRPDEVIVIGGPARPRHPSLIEIPSSFVSAIAKSLEEL